MQSPIAPSRASEADLKIMPIRAIIASLPLAISVLNFFLLSSGSAMNGALGTPSGPKTQPINSLDLMVVRPAAKQDESLPGMSLGSWQTATDLM